MESETENGYDPYIYVVSEARWEYTDGLYFKVANYGRGKEAFLIKKLAAEYVDDLNFNWFLKNLNEFNNPSQYFFGKNYFSLDIEKLIKDIKYLKWDDEDKIFYSNHPEKIKKDQILSLMNELDINQYYVQALKLRG